MPGHYLYENQLGAASRSLDMKPTADESEDDSDEWNADKQFKAAVLKPPAKKMTPGGSSNMGYTVWCSSGDLYSAPNTKYFDSTWHTKTDANEHARYLFYWKNCWGMEPEEMSDTMCCDDVAGDIGGLTQYDLTDENDHGTWTVGVAPDCAFPYLDHSSERHCHDSFSW